MAAASDRRQWTAADDASQVGDGVRVASWLRDEEAKPALPNFAIVMIKRAAWPPEFGPARTGLSLFEAARRGTLTVEERRAVRWPTEDERPGRCWCDQSHHHWPD